MRWSGHRVVADYNNGLSSRPPALRLVMLEREEIMKDDFIKMPRSLTAANGAKGLLSGEFYEEVRIACPYCNGESADNGQNACKECDSSGSQVMKVPVSWSSIKEIYAKAVEFFAEA